MSHRACVYVRACVRACVSIVDSFIYFCTIDSGEGVCVRVECEREGK